MPNPPISDDEDTRFAARGRYTERRLALSFALTLALLLGILGLCFWQGDNFVSSEWWADHANRVMRDIAGILSEVQTAESNQRGFRVAGNEEFIVPYQQALDALPGKLAALRERLRDDPAQERRCDQLAALIEAKKAVMRAYIDDRRALGPAALDPARATGRGRQAMAAVLAKGREMVEAESLLWRERDTARAHHLRVGAGTLLGTGALCVALLTAGFVISRRELRRRRSLGASLARANAGLSGEVAERRRAQASLHESEARFRRIANNVPGMVFRSVRRADGGVAFPFVSEGCRRIFGLEAAAAQGDAGLILGSIHPEDRAEFKRTARAAAEAAGPWHWQGRIVRPGTGEVRFVEGTSQPERQPDGELVWDGVLVDVTERRGADELLRAKQEAERTNEEKSRFLSRVSHELRTPLNAILGFGQLMELSPLDERDRESLDYMLRGARHLLALVDEVLDLSRAETGELHLALARVEPGIVASECVGLLSALARKHGVTCVARPPAAPLALRCDGQRLRQVLFNLLSNAIKYNRPGGQVEVWCEATPAGRRRVKVRDTGPGIPPADAGKLFLPFERLEHEDGGVEGTGLGLAVSRRIAEAMDGGMGVESTVGVGSTFWIELPAADDAVAERPAPVASLDAPAGGGGAAVAVAAPGVPASARVLYVEDNDSNLRAVERLLGRLRPQWHLLTAADGERGLELARRTLPDVVLLDRHLPGLMGEQVLAELRGEAATARIPVIVLSADATAASRDCLLARGADGYISKPFELQTLMQAVEQALAKRVAC